MDQARPSFQFKCAKCGSQSYVIRQLKGSSGGLAAFLDVEDVPITLVACTVCAYADVYLTDQKQFMNVYGLKD